MLVLKIYVTILLEHSLVIDTEVHNMLFRIIQNMYFLTQLFLERIRSFNFQLIFSCSKFLHFGYNTLLF